jgi:hypothetical protein
VRQAILASSLYRYTTESMLNHGLGMATAILCQIRHKRTTTTGHHRTRNRASTHRRMDGAENR